MKIKIVVGLVYVIQLQCTTCFERGESIARRRIALYGSNKDHEDEEEKRSAVLKISYDGRHFHGWSAANDQQIHHKTKQGTSKKRGRRRRGVGKWLWHGKIRSVESVIRDNLAKVYGDVDPKQVRVVGCSRTDRGVHARSLVARIDCSGEEGVMGLPFGGDLEKLQFTLNRMLPFDVRINDVAYSPYAGFHPTVDALEKTYQYTFSIGAAHDPLQRRYVWHVSPPSAHNFDLCAVLQCTELLQGQHDFSAFKGAFRGSDRNSTKVVNPICIISRFQLELIDHETLDHVTSSSPLSPTHGNFFEHNSLQTYRVTVTGNRFLYKMVRFLVGTVVAVGLRHIDVRDVSTALDTKERNGNMLKYVKCAPPYALVLTDVDYGEDVVLDWILGGHSR